MKLLRLLNIFLVIIILQRVALGESATTCSIVEPRPSISSELSILNNLSMKVCYPTPVSLTNRYFEISILLENRSSNSLEILLPPNFISLTFLDQTGIPVYAGEAFFPNPLPGTEMEAFKKLKKEHHFRGWKYKTDSDWTNDGLTTFSLEMASHETKKISILARQFAQREPNKKFSEMIIENKEDQISKGNSGTYKGSLMIQIAENISSKVQRYFCSFLIDVSI